MQSQQVIRNYLLIAGIYTLSASLIWGVNTLFLLDAGLDIAEVFIANAVFTAGMVLFEIPTGVLADTTGRRASFLWSTVVLLLSTLGYVAVAEWGGGLLAFSVVSLFLGLGFTFYSGAVEAWLVDALDSTGYDGELDHVFARGSMISGAAMLIGSVSGGIIGSVDLAFPFILRAILLGVAFAVAYRTMHDLGYQPKALSLGAIPAEMRRIAGASVQYGWREPQMKLLMLASFIQMGFMAWAFYAWQPYILDLFGDPDAVWVVGILAALISVATIIGNSITDWETHRSGKRTTLMIWSLSIFSIAMVGVGLTTSFWVAVPLFLLAMMTLGVAGPVRQSYIHHIVPSEQRATVVSVDSMFSSGGSVLGQTGLGQLSLRVGIAEGYVLGGFATMLCVPLVVMLRRLGNEADIIVGDAGHQGGQAAQGLPEVSHVDCKPRHGVSGQSADSAPATEMPV